MKRRYRFMRKESEFADSAFCGPRLKSRARFRPQPTLATYVPLPLEEAIRTQSAELWLRLGEPFEALAELANMSACRRRNSWVHRVQAAALHAARSGMFQ